MRRAGLSIAAFGVVCALAGTASADEGERPRGRYIRVDPPPEALTIEEAETQAEGHILFLNRCPGGITITNGASDDSRTNKSSIVSGSVHLDEFPFGDASWNQIVQDVRGIFAPFGIVVTDVDPGNVPHDEALVCGADTDANFQPAAGVAPFTCARIPNAITFTFPETIGDDTRYTSETIAQEAAHAWGLDHSFKCEDPMTYLLGCGNKSFQDGDYSCGEYEARACDCGNPTQNTYQHILGLFGAGVPDTQAPIARIVAPMDGDRFDPGADFDIAIEVSDDVDVTRVALFVDGEQLGSDNAPPFTGWPVQGIEPGQYQFRVEAQDSSGNVGQSNVVTIQVGLGGPGGDAGGDDNDVGDSDGGGDDEDEEEDSDGGDGGGGGIYPGAFPTYERGDPSGCGCRASGSGGAPVGLVLLGFVSLLRRRRSAER